MDAVAGGLLDPAAGTGPAQRDDTLGTAKAARPGESPTSQGVSGDGRERLDEVRMGVEGVDPAEAQPAALGLLTGADIDVIEDLEMVGQEQHRGDEDRTLT
jgi:hypothetical protein